MPTKLTRYAEAVIELCVLTAVLLIPVFFDVYSARVFEPDKLTFLRSLAWVAIFAWGVRVLDLHGPWQETRPPDAERVLPSDWRAWFLRTPLVLPTALFILIYVVSTLFSITPATSLWGSYQRLQGTYTTFSYITLFVVLASTIRRREQIDRLVTGAIIASVPVCLYAIIQHNQLDPLPWGGDVTERVAANMGNAIFVAAYMIMIVPLTLGRIVTTFHAILTEERVAAFDVTRAAIYIFIFMIQGVTIFWSGSRGPWIGLIVCVWVLALFGLLMLRRTTEGRGVVGFVDVALAIGGVLGANALGLGVMWVLVNGLSAVRVLTAPDAETLQLIQVGLIVLGFMALGMVLTFALALFKSTWRWVWLAAVIELVFLVGFLGLLNVKGGPLESVRKGHRIERFATIFETEDGTGRVRVLIWEGAFKLIMPHEPLAFPDKTVDPWNVLRPFIGYGPEGMYVAYNPFYPPELAQLESRNASPDRSHNETFDSLVITGLFGLIAYMFLFGSVFYYGYLWLGWIGGRRSTLLYAGLWTVGALIGGLGPIAIGKPEYLGVALPAGALGLGVILYVMLYALFRYGIELPAFLFLAGFVGLAGGALGAVAVNVVWIAPAALVASLVLGAGLYFVGAPAFADFVEPEHELDFNQKFLLVALVSAIIGHFVEINFGGIAIAATRTLFWVFTGMMVVVGYMRPRARAARAKLEATATPAQEPARAGAAGTRRPRRVPGVAVSRVERLSLAGGAMRWVGPALMLAVVLGMVLSTIGFELLNNTGNTSTPSTDPGKLIWQSLTVLPALQGRPTQSETGTTLGLLVVTWLVGVTLFMSELARSGAFRDEPGSWTNGVWTVGGGSIAIAAFFYFMIASTLIATGGLGRGATSYADAFRRIADGLAQLITIYYFVMFSLLFLGAAALTLGWSLPQTTARPIAAGLGVVGLFAAWIIIAQTNLAIVQADIVYKQADAVDKQAASLANDNGSQPQGQPQQTPEERAKLREEYWRAAVEVYRHALELAPSEDYYYLFLGRAYLEYASATSDAAKQDSRLAEADSELQRARRINPLNTDHTANLARLHRRWSDLVRSRGGTLDQQTSLLNDASDYYDVATQLSPNNAVLWNEWCTLRTDNMGDWENGLKLCEHSLSIDAKYDQTYFIMGDLYVRHITAITGTVPLTTVRGMLGTAAGFYEEAGKVLESKKQYAASSSAWNTACVMWDQAFRNEDAIRDCEKIIELSQTTVPQLQQDADFWRTYVTLLGLYERVGDACQASGDTICAQTSYQKAVTYGQQGTQFAPPEEQTGLNTRITLLQGKLAGGSNLP